ncbi:MAG TPA: hypothetical protein VNY52_13410 [Solirubrobacteraceae bacterium]|jgi:hypothetical protein|nr:hypothetical protein [Solirubrobacteraceae bacterium]
MAAPSDLLYVQHLIDSDAIHGTVLELGSYNRQGFDGGNFRALCERGGLQWEGTDIEAGPGVDFTLDLLDRDAVTSIGRRWDTVLVMNLLEHVYDPIRVLEHALLLLAGGGALVVAGPTVWQLHDFPGDYWRPMPDFFLEFARRNGCTLDIADMRWLVGVALIPLDDLSVGTQKLLPSTFNAGRLYGGRRARWSRLVHRAAHTIGRDLFFPYAGLGVCMVSGGSQATTSPREVAAAVRS